MAQILDFKGLKCPQPVLKTAIQANSIPAGTTIEIHADCPSFPADIEKWCATAGKVLVSIVDQGGYNVATVQL